MDMHSIHREIKMHKEKTRHYAQENRRKKIGHLVDMSLKNTGRKIEEETTHLNATQWRMAMHVEAAT